jgi:hypothetical protein
MSARPLRRVAAALPLVVVLSAWGAPVPVVHREGSARGFLVLRNQAGDPIADGEMLQSVQSDRGREVEAKLVFRFRDGSYSEETAVFLQDGAFRLLRYEQVQRGPSFATDHHASLDARSGRYTVRARDRDDGDVTKDDGVLELPADTANGLVPILLKNLPRGGTVHVVGFAPKPTVLEVAISTPRETAGSLGAVSLPVARYVLTPQLGPVKKAFAKLLGKMPTDTVIWIARGDAPTFLRYEGSLAVGLPRWRIESALVGLPR